MKTAEHFDILLISATLVVIAVVAGVAAYHKSLKIQQRHETVFEKRVEANVDQLVNNQSDTSQLFLPGLPVDNVSAEEYRSKIYNLVAVYNSETLNYFAAETAYKYSLDQLLNMPIPEGYNNLHIELLVRFEDLYQAMQSVNNNKPLALSDLEVARESMDLFLEENSWLKK